MDFSLSINYKKDCFSKEQIKEVFCSEELLKENLEITVLYLGRKLSNQNLTSVPFKTCLGWRIGKVFWKNLESIKYAKKDLVEVIRISLMDELESILFQVGDQIILSRLDTPQLCRIYCHAVRLFNILQTKPNEDLQSLEEYIHEYNPKSEWTPVYEMKDIFGCVLSFLNIFEKTRLRILSKDMDRQIDQSIKYMQQYNDVEEVKYKISENINNIWFAFLNFNTTNNRFLGEEEDSIIRYFILEIDKNTALLKTVKAFDKINFSTSESSNKAIYKLAVNIKLEEDVENFKLVNLSDEERSLYPFFNAFGASNYIDMVADKLIQTLNNQMKFLEEERNNNDMIRGSISQLMLIRNREGFWKNNKNQPRLD